MSRRTAVVLSGVHALAIGLGLAQQAAFAAVFGVTPVAGMFFLAMTPPVITAMIYAESLQLSLLPELVRAANPRAGAEALARSLAHAAMLGLPACGIGLLWGWFVDGRVPIDWPLYAGFVAMLSLAHVISMAASSMVVWLQADHDLVLPSTVHLIPGVLGTAVIVASADLMVVCAAYIVIGLVQAGWLCSLSLGLRDALALIGRGGLRTASKWFASPPRLLLPALLIGAAIPLIQLVDRLARATADLSGTAAASYAWAVTLGLAAVMGRGPTFVYSLLVSSDALATRRRMFALPVGLYALGLAIGALGWVTVSAASTHLLERFPDHQPLIEALAIVLPQLLLCLAPVVALPGLYRIVVRLSSLEAGARMVAWQFLGQVALTAASLLYLGSSTVGYSAAIAAHLSFASLLVLTLRLHASATGAGPFWS